MTCQTEKHVLLAWYVHQCLASFPRLCGSLDLDVLTGSALGGASRTPLFGLGSQEFRCAS